MSINIGSMNPWEFIGFIMICTFILWLMVNGLRILAGIPTKEDIRKIIREELRRDKS